MHYIQKDGKTFIYKGDEDAKRTFCHEIQHVKNFYDSKFGGRLQLQFA